ncbi:uncharacterized protein RHO25_012034 [Cercospora beticola]|uniref:Uncharacterized protein n=1 Tax=Cercospora beticola TaxID=122368 RepID=A0ABZ0P662_CERBT|nr:hypothetical protein RHO25_012034 [Cercospora beticola]CAK1367354.1 unnamed protein product [Cercospora beticola]
MDWTRPENEDACELLRQGRDACLRLCQLLFDFILVLTDLFLICSLLVGKSVVACGPLILGVVVTCFYFSRQNDASSHVVDNLVRSFCSNTFFGAYMSSLVMMMFGGWLITSTCAAIDWAVRAAVNYGLTCFDTEEEWDQFLKRCWQAVVRTHPGFFPQQSGMWDLKEPVDGHNFQDETRQTLNSEPAIDSGDHDAPDSTSSAEKKSSNASETC